MRISVIYKFTDKETVQENKKKHGIEMYFQESVKI